MRAGTASTIDGPPNFAGATVPLRSAALLGDPDKIGTPVARFAAAGDAGGR